MQVDTYTDPVSALGSMRRNPPDLAVVDMQMPRMDGLEFLNKFQKDAVTPVVILSEQESEIEEVMALRMGAEDYLRKPVTPQILVERLRTCARRRDETRNGRRYDKMLPVISRGPLEVNPNTYVVRWKGKTVNLTSKEFKLLQALAEKPEHVRSREQLLDMMYSDGIFFEDRIIDSHIKRIRRKIREIDPTFDAIETIYGVGYKIRLFND